MFSQRFLDALEAFVTVVKEESGRGPQAGVLPGPGIGDPVPPTEPVVWYRDTSSPVPTVPLNDLTDVDALKRYLAHGFRANLTRGVATQDWDQALKYADGVFNASTPQEANAAMGNAGNFDPDTAVELILGGATQGSAMTGGVTIYAQPMGMSFTDAAVYLIATPGIPGPSGR
jgi:hypothetical protein